MTGRSRSLPAASLLLLLLLLLSLAVAVAAFEPGRQDEPERDFGEGEVTETDADCSVWSTVRREFELLASEPLVLSREGAVDPETARAVWLAGSLPRSETGPGNVDADAEAEATTDRERAERSRLEAESRDRWNRLQESLPELERETIEAYLVRNRPLPVDRGGDSERPPPELDLDLDRCHWAGVELAGSEALDEVFRTAEPWESFFRRYPDAGGLARLSRPGFNGAGTQALVYVSKSWGSLAGQGHLLFLQRVEGDWKIAGGVMLWIS